MRRRFVLLWVVVISTLAQSQNTPTDSQNLRALLEEVRQLRRDLQTTTVAAQRVQIALYRLQLQEAAVTRVTKIVEEAGSKLAQLAAERKRVAAGLVQAEDQRNRSQDPRERKVIEEEVLPQIKRHLEQLTNEEQQWQAKENEAEGELRTGQAKLDALHVVLDQLDQALEHVGRKGEGTPPPAH